MALAGRLSPTQLSRMARRARRKSAEEADRLRHRRRLNARRDEQSGGVWLDGVLFDDDAATFTSAVDAYLATSTTNPATGRYDPLDMRVADAVLDMARAYLAGKSGDPRPTVVVHADARILFGQDGWAETTGWTALAAETIRRLACHCKLNVVADNPDGTPIGVGRAQRLAPHWLADHVRHRDGGCRMCGQRLFTQIHHITPWEPPWNGRTDADVLCELCSEHHHLVHEGGWRITGNPNNELRFTSPTGRTITSHPACPPTPTPPQPAATAGVRSDAPSLLDNLPGHTTRPAAPAPPSRRHTPKRSPIPTPPHAPSGTTGDDTASPTPSSRRRPDEPNPTPAANPHADPGGEQPDPSAHPTPPPQPDRQAPTPTPRPHRSGAGTRRPTKLPGDAPPGPAPNKHHNLTPSSEPTLFGGPTALDDT